MGISENLNGVISRIRAAALKAGRDPGHIRLVVVSKTVGPDKVMEAVSAGAVILGENRVQEAAAKMEALTGRIPAGVEWHLIGTLQKNKARHAVGVFALIHSVDSVELAREIDRQAAKRGLVQDILLELNIAGEASKHGFAPDDAKAAAKEVSALEKHKPQRVDVRASVHGRPGGFAAFFHRDARASGGNKRYGA